MCLWRRSRFAQTLKVPRSSTPRAFTCCGLAGNPFERLWNLKPKGVRLRSRGTQIFDMLSAVRRSCRSLWPRYGPQRIPKSNATLVLSFGTGGERVMWCRFTMRVVEKAIFGPT